MNTKRMSVTNQKRFPSTAKKRSWMVGKLFVCIAVTGVALFSYIDKQNELTELRLLIPSLAKEVKNIQETNIRLKYEIERFESPIHLIELMRKPEFSHLKYPYLNEEIFLPKATIGIPETYEAEF